MYPFKLFILIPAIVLTVSCSIDYGDTGKEEEIGDNIPDTIISNFSYTSVDNGNIVFRISSLRAQNFSIKKETTLSGVVFREYNRKGEIITEGESEKGVIYTESDDAELTGSIRIYSAPNETEIIADYLFWNDSEKTLSGAGDGFVKMIRDSGTEISGRGFEGDIKTRLFTFEKDVNGLYHYEED